MIYGSQNFAVAFPGILGPAEKGVTGPEWSEARVRVLFQRLIKINSTIKERQSE